MTRPCPRGLLLGLLVPVAATACALHDVQANPAPEVSLPQAFAGQAGDAARRERWWEEFGDGGLTTWVERALQDNLQLRAAWARLAQAMALTDQATASFFPFLGLDASANRTHGFFSVAGRTFDATTYSASLMASYELDVFGKLSSNAKAAALDELATRDDVESLAMTLSAEVAETWFDLIAHGVRSHLLQVQLGTNQTFLDLVELRFDQGLATALDVLQQRQTVSTSQALLAQAEAQHAVARNRLAVLLGVAPGGLDLGSLPSALPVLSPTPEVGLPASLLEQRPDIRAARRRLEASDHRINVALANLLPALRITGNVGFSASSLSELTDQLIWSVVGNVLAPLFEGGRRAAELDGAEALVRERASQYGSAVLQALLEVENALTQEHHQRRQLVAIDEQVSNAERTLSEARERYLQGLSDYLPVLTALQTLHAAQQSALTAQRQLVSYRVQLCRALGGSWTQALSDPAEDDSGSASAGDLS